MSPIPVQEKSSTEGLTQYPLGTPSPQIQAQQASKTYCGFPNCSKVHSLDELIQKLHEVFEGDEVNVDEVETLMRSYVSNPMDWRKYAKFDQYRYTRNLVDEGNGKFNLLILCWGEGHGSSVHDHADSHCFMKVIQGSLAEVRFEWPESEESSLVEKGRTILPLNDVAYINDSLGLHRVENMSHTEPAVSLHLYCPPFDACSMFDTRTGKRVKCQVTFWSKFGQRTSYGDEESVQQPENN